MMHPLIERFEALLEQHAPDYLERLERPADDDALAQARDVLGDCGELWVELHTWRNGSSDWASLWGSNELLSLETSASIKQTMDGLEADGTFDKWAPNEWWHPGWVPIFDNHSYDTYVIDTEGCWGGEPGQIIHWMKDGPARPAIAPSFEDWLEVFCDLVDGGQLVWKPDEGGFGPPGHDLVDTLIASHFDGYPCGGEARTRYSLGIERTIDLPERVECAEGFHAEVTHQVWAPAESGVACLEWIEDLGVLAVGQSAFGGADFPALSLVEPTTGEIEREIQPAGGGTMACRWLGERRQLVYLLNAAGREIWVWDADSGDNRQLVGDFWETRMHDAFDAAGRWAVHAGEAVRLYDLDTGEARTVPVARSNQVSAALSPTGDRLAVHLPNGPIRIFAVSDDTLEMLAEWPVESEAFSQMRFDSQGEVLTALEWYSNAIERFDADGNPLPFTDDPGRPLAMAAAGRNGLWAVAAGAVTIYDRAGAQVYLDNAHQFARVHGLAFDDEGRRLFSAGADGQIATRTMGEKLEDL
jgi:cell wall assembly regulator SMI1